MRVIDQVSHTAGLRRHGWRKAQLDLLLVGCLAATILFWRLGDRPLVDWDEALYAQVAREMVEEGNWLELSWSHQPYFKKPPLLFWTIALSYQVFDVSEWATRVPSVLFGIGSTLLVSLLGRLLYGRIAGVCSGLLLLTFYPFLSHGSRQSATDSPLLFFSLLALYCFCAGRRRPSWLLGVGVALGAGMLAKGIAAFLPILGIVLFCLWSGEFQHLRSRFFSFGLVSGMLLALPWYGYQVVKHGVSFVRTFLWDETLTRLVTTYDADFRPWSFYLETLWTDLSHCFPLLVGFPTLCVLSRWRKQLPCPPELRFVICWLVTALIVVFSTQTRHSWYLLPVYPPLCVFVVGVGASVWRYSAALVGPRPAVVLLQRAVMGIIVGWFLLLLPSHVRWVSHSLVWMEDFYQDRNAFLQEVRETLDPSVPLYVVGPAMPGVVFYSQRPAVFLSTDDLNTLERDLVPAYALVPSDALVERMGEAGFTVLGHRGDWFLLANVPVVQAGVDEGELILGEEQTDEL